MLWGITAFTQHELNKYLRKPDVQSDTYLCLMYVFIDFYTLQNWMEIV